MDKVIREIVCKCGEWEEMPVDTPRNKSQNFHMVSTVRNGEAIYECDCGKLITNKLALAD